MNETRPSARVRTAADMASTLRIGLFADVQYADKPDNPWRDEFGRARLSFFRGALSNLGDALSQLASHSGPGALAFTIQLGDIVDGYKDDAARGEQDLATVVAELRKYPLPRLFHVIGNHCRYVPLPVLKRELGLEKGTYYSFTPEQHIEWRFIVLDASEVYPGAIDATSEDETQFQAACERCQVPQIQRDARNGAVTKQQLEWLESEMCVAQKRNQTVLLFGHFPLYEHASCTSHLLMNASEVLAIMDRFEPHVLAYFCGHDHVGGYAVRNNVHHITLQGMLEAPVGTNAYAIASLHRTADVLDSAAIDLRGFGTVPSRVLTKKRSELV
ncbi:Manganese-dependent ADP-ribose/CDP-alcohol diphosphatase [Porphyridium purpureum]|uniref:Manganese-dependent ADP-ribose/CDP-alcohol diphosphatase n=1 Tax=Porphyridium purpureum TaxID=35688 RepID=A0A5J4YQZ3_PORPP|nr:Manganese-dependent ADP-ribose/CDP-alcohol diphosphatase [Porphyridium purpureum]|eukprot:POR5586..scf296_7